MNINEDAQELLNSSITKPSMILGLDPATRTGYAYGDDKTLIGFGEIDLRSSGKGDVNQAFCYPGRLYAALKQLKIAKDTFVCVENSSMMPLKSKRAIEIQIGAIAIIRCWCYDNDLKYMETTPGELKTFATGNGRCDKERMIAFSRKWGYEGDNDNVADAVHLWRYGCAYWSTWENGKQILTQQYSKKGGKAKAIEKKLKASQLSIE